jgi:hypothetical protein
MIKKIVAFGDSTVYGKETTQDLIPEDELKQAQKRIFGYSGELKIEDRQSHSKVKEWFNFLKSLHDDYNAKCNELSFVGQLGKLLDVPYQNFSFPGYSNVAVMSSIVKNMKYIDDNTLVIVGITFPWRYTRFHEHGHIEVTINPVNKYNVSTKDLIKWEEFSAKFGDDVLTRIYYVVQHSLAVQQLLKNNQVLLIDAMGYYRDVEDNLRYLMFEHSCHHMTDINFIQKFFDDNMVPFSLESIFEVLNRASPNRYSKKLYGHHGMAINELYAKHLVSYLKDKNWI